LAWAEDRKDEIERLKKLEVYRKEFLGNVSHELKTPIFNIQGYVLTLLDGGLEDPSINRNYLERAEKSIDRMITIVDDLEAISQLETGELQIDQERFDIVALAKDVADAQEMKATARGIILTFPEDSKPIFVYGDRFRIRQVFVNLIVNSVKYGKEYGETKIRFYDVGENIVIEIADNGIGIEKQHLARLFERFYRVDKSRSREQGGTGLGLAIVKHIIEAHGQTINVMSTEGAGTVFTFTLKKGN
jgi:two-component system phosphate regulon sensor histidine kinase PhoR